MIMIYEGPRVSFFSSHNRATENPNKFAEPKALRDTRHEDNAWQNWRCNLRKHGKLDGLIAVRSHHRETQSLSPNFEDASILCCVLCISPFKAEHGLIK